MEYYDVLNIDREKTGETLPRGSSGPGALRNVVHVAVFNGRGELLIQRRQPFVVGWAGYWDVSCGGMVSAGESSRFAAQRELFEELGLTADLSQTRPLLTLNFDGGFDDYYAAELDVPLSAVRLQDEEVAEARWATLEEVFALLEEGAFIPYYKSFLRLLFELRGGMPSHAKNRRAMRREGT